MPSPPPPSGSPSFVPSSLYRPTKNLRRIGLAAFVAVLFGYCTGGPFAFESMISQSGPGLALTFLIVVPFLLSIPISLATAEMTTILPVEGGFYRWSRAALGDFWGFQCGWWNWTGTFLMSAAYGVTMADYFENWLPVHSRIEHWAVAVTLLMVVAYLNVRGIHVVGNLTLLLLLVMAVPLVVFVIVGFHHARFNPFHPFLPTGKPWQEAYGIGLAIALWTYAGYEQLSTVIEEVENPTRNFPIGLAIVIPLSIAIYVLTLASGLAALGNWREWETGYLVTAGRLMGGNALSTGIFVASGIASFVLLDSTVLSVSRLPFTMAEDGYFHPGLGKISARFGTPVRSILLSTALCSALAVFTVPQLIAVYAWTRMATSIETMLSFWQFRRKYPDVPRSFRAPGGRFGALLMVVAPTLLFTWVMIYSDVGTRKWGLLNLASGPLAYLWVRQRRSKATPQPDKVVAG
ncbi:MAG TPA: APC family permease [Terriglobales bacterium]|nr:APC family permease [Terriglobales bacterium]